MSLFMPIAVLEFNTLLNIATPSSVNAKGKYRIPPRFCQIGILNNRRGGNIKYKPFAFTELGVSMLSSVLNSKTAIDENRRIMRAFVAIRQYLMEYVEMKHEFTDFKRETNTRLDKNDVKVDEVFNMLKELFEQKKSFENRKRIGFNADKI
jgi:hypothetical protein